MAGHTPWRKIRDLPGNVDRPGWAANLEVAGEPVADDDQFDEQLCDLVDALDAHGGVASGGQGHDRYGATFSVYTESNSAAEVVDQALLIFHEAAVKADLPPWPVVRCEVMTFAEQDADLDAQNA